MKHYTLFAAIIPIINLKKYIGNSHDFIVGYILVHAILLEASSTLRWKKG